MPEFAGETFVRTDNTEGRDPNEKLTVVLDYFRYAFVRQKAFSGLVVFDVLPSKESPETTRFWVRMDPREATDPVLTGYGDPPANVSQSKPIRVTMGRDDFFYLWSGEASSPALVAALLVTGRVKVDNWLRFGDLRHFVSSFNYATPSWIAFYRGRGQIENVERLFEAQRIRARSAGKVVDENTGDIVDLIIPIQNQQVAMSSTVTHNSSSMTDTLNDSSIKMISNDKNATTVEKETEPAFALKAENVIDLDEAIESNDTYVSSSLSNLHDTSHDRIPHIDSSPQHNLQVQDSSHLQANEVSIIEEKHLVVSSTSSIESEHAASPSSTSESLDELDTTSALPLSLPSSSSPTALPSQSSQLLLDQSQGRIASVSQFNVPALFTITANGEEVFTDFKSNLPKLLLCSPIKTSEIASLASSLHLHLLSGFSDMVEFSQRLANVEVVVTPFLETATKNIERALQLEATLMKSLPSDVENVAKGILSLDGLTRVLHSSFGHITDVIDRTSSLWRERGGQTAHIEQQVEALNHSSAIELHRAAKELRLVATGKLVGTLLSHSLWSPSPTLLTSFIQQKFIFFQLTRSTGSIEAPNLQLVMSNSLNWKTFTGISEESQLENALPKQLLSRHINSSQIVSLNESLRLDFGKVSERETYNNEINHLVRSSLEENSATDIGVESIQSKHSGVVNDMNILNVSKAAAAFNAGPSELVRVASGAVLAAARAGGLAASLSLQVHFPGLFSTILDESKVNSSSGDVSFMSSSLPESSLSSVSQTLLSQNNGSMFAQLWKPSLKSSCLPLIHIPFRFLTMMSMSADTEHSPPLTVSAEALEFATLTTSEIVKVSDVSEVEAISYCLGVPLYFSSSSSPPPPPPPVALAALQFGSGGDPTSSTFGLVPILCKNRKNVAEKSRARFAVYNGLGSGLFLSTAKERVRMRLDEENEAMSNLSYLSMWSRKFANAGYFKVKFADIDE